MTRTARNYPAPKMTPEQAARTAAWITARREATPEQRLAGILPCTCEHRCGYPAGKCNGRPMGC